MTSRTGGPTGRLAQFFNGKIIAQQIGAQIFIDGWAMVAPGNPELAADLARRAASVSHDGEAIYASQVLAAMEAFAFVESNIDKLIDIINVTSVNCLKKTGQLAYGEYVRVSKTIEDSVKKDLQQLNESNSEERVKLIVESYYNKLNNFLGKIKSEQLENMKIAQKKHQEEKIKIEIDEVQVAGIIEGNDVLVTDETETVQKAIETLK